MIIHIEIGQLLRVTAHIKVAVESLGETDFDGVSIHRREAIMLAQDQHRIRMRFDDRLGKFLVTILFHLFVEFVVLFGRLLFDRFQLFLFDERELGDVGVIVGR